MAHTDLATFLADKAVVQRVGFTTHTQLRCVFDLYSLDLNTKAECCPKREIIYRYLCRYFNFANVA